MYNYGSNVMCGVTAGFTGMAAVAAGQHMGSAFLVAEATSSFSWMVAGLVIVAKTGIDY
jgi:hypothetical protein